MSSEERRRSKNPGGKRKKDARHRRLSKKMGVNHHQTQLRRHNDSTVDAAVDKENRGFWRPHWPWRVCSKSTLRLCSSSETLQHMVDAGGSGKRPPSTRPTCPLDRAQQATASVFACFDPISARNREARRTRRRRRCRCGLCLGDNKACWKMHHDMHVSFPLPR